MNEETKIKARILAGKDPKFREFLKRNPQVAEIIYNSKYDKNGAFIPFGRASNQQKNQINSFFGQPRSNTSNWNKSETPSNTSYERHESRINNIDSGVNPATGLMTSSQGGIDCGGNAYGTNNNWY